ncbi:D-alanyl-D-alanine carboxypeptidase/D-alanyl-D-alanine-endopeptidase [Arthrobacter sp. B3I4]|uniref:D-alanyl-D-alanine carboxypeptidase/D-alanyl-D-alanine endopeptidase n=1 Tax=Arthrobacter sp. B3I4 TaxID=3042267 RepID=UPI002785CCB1|nr:D-alanyl-D-alanine carboxypeptidase/D-alanyl-D-alanine-endopeptidase [Arthrobacter sp. B3I4]MDQ0754616.1 D-alanyl-D-alanine carboxypeptidase/D-alanyl-D-alanine-endopeptidase (penicillin-binding protein 4) [Arthrobacter sp. B3I4]
MTPKKGQEGAAPPPGRLGRSLPLLLLMLLVVALAVPAGVAIGPGFLGPARPPGPAPAGPWQLPPATLSTAAGSGSGAGIRPLNAAAPVPDAAALAAQLSATLKADGAGSFSGMVQDAATGEVLFDRSGDEGRAPASNIKLLTAAAALRTLGPDRRFSTRTVAGSTPGTVVLTAGGDVLLGAGDSAPDAVLGHAGLATLARSTVQALQQGGATGPVSVLLDDSLFTGPALSPAWSPEDVAAGEVAPLFPLALNSARFTPGTSTGPRPQDAAMTAAEAFAARLTEAGAAVGIAVAPGVIRGPAPQPAPDGGQAGKVLAAVESATVSQQVDLLLRTSDNYLTEVMGRMVATASGKPASNNGAVAAVLQQLEELGIPAASLHAADLAGLTLDNRVSARQLTAVIRAMTTGPDTRLRSALAGFPVAGLTGTLGSRYSDTSTAGGAGLVRAKTGTLNTVIALSGYVVDADGRLLVFSFIGNGLTPGAAGNKEALDRTASVLAACGCR